MSGLPAIGTMHFGMVSVRGRRRVPSPAASKRALARRCGERRLFGDIANDPELGHELLRVVENVRHGARGAEPFFVSEHALAHTALRLPAERLQLAHVREDVTRVAVAIFPGGLRD